jgi:SagB-type dehydrogenase family enzyme
MRVKGLEPGIYHYSVERDALTLVKKGFFEEEVIDICRQGDYVRGSSAVFFMTSIVERSMWKYPMAHALRVILLDAGHLGQTFHLVCTALGLAPFTFAATDTDGIEKLLSIDGVREIPVYTCTVGVPAEVDDARADRLGGAPA